MRKILRPCLTALIVFAFLSIMGGCADSGGSGGSSSNQDSDSDTSSIDIVINELVVDTSSGDLDVTLLVSAVDENGDLIEDLDLSDFTIYINGSEIDAANLTLEYIDEQEREIPDPVSVAILMDYSTSITDDATVKDDMEAAVIWFIGQKRSTDEAAILKFNSGIKYQGAFTTDTATLEDEVLNETVTGGSTYLYDALYTSIEAVALRANRPAVVAVTDGANLYESGVDPTLHKDEDDVVSLAQDNGVPLFLVGLGNDIDEEVLDELATDSGGNFYSASASSELEGIYGSISELLTVGQYEMVITTTYSGESTGRLQISVDYNGITDSLNTTFAIP